MGLLAAVLIGLILILYGFDLFYESPLLPLAGYILGAIAIYVLSGEQKQPLILAIPVYLAISIVLHFTVWRHVILPKVVDRIAPDRYEPGKSGLLGKTAIIVEIEGNRLVSLDDEFWPASEDLAPGTRVTIDGVHRGTLRITPLDEGI